MAETIKGISVVIGAETTGLQKALSDVNKQGRNIQSELRQVNKALKFDPSSTTLLTQKQELLGKSIETTREKLNRLKSVQDQVNKQFENGEINEGQYRAFQREIDITQNKLKNLEGQLKSTSPALQSFGEKASAASEKLKKAGDTATSIGKTMSLGITTPLVGAAAAAVKIGNDFETSMSQAAGALDKPMAQMGSLRDLALKTGQDTQFSATEAGNAITELAKGGLTEAQIKGGSLKATMDLAASSSMDLGTAANTVVQSMGAFGLSASQSSQAVNALAGAAAASSTDVQPLSEGLAQCAAQAHLVGWSIQDTAAVLGEFADAGVVGSDAGTSLKTMLRSLGAPTATASKTMESLGINVWDSSGHMKNAAGIAKELQSKMGGLSDSQKQAAMSTIFGSDATRAASILMNNGASGLQKYTKATNDQSSASRLAASQMGETSKSIEQMFGALETAAIQVQGALAPTITAIANKIGDLATAFSNLSPTAQTVILAVAGIAAAIGPLLIVIGGILSVIGTVTGAIGAVAGGATAATPAIAGLATVIRGVVTAFTAITSPIGLVIAGITAVGIAVYAAVTHWDALKTTVSNFVTNLPTMLSTAITFISQFITTLVNAIATNLPQILATGTQILDTIITSITTNLPKLMTIGSQIITNLITSINNNLPSIISTGIEIITTLITGIINNLSTILSVGVEIITKIVEAITNNLPTIIETATKIITTLITGILQVLPQLIGAGLAIILALAKAIVQNLPQIIQSATKIITALVKAITDNLPQIVAAAVKIIIMLAKALIQNLPLIISAAIQIIVAIVKGLAQALPQLVSYIPVIAKAIMSGLKQVDWGSVGSYIIKGIIAGLKAMGGALWDAAKATAKAALQAAKDALGIHSPSRVFRDEVGAQIPAGMAIGINKNVKQVTSAVSGIAEQMSSYLHFSAPDKGALSDFAKWMPDFVKGLAQGIKDNTVYVRNAAMKLGSIIADAVMPERNTRASYLSAYTKGIMSADKALIDLDGSNKILEVSTKDEEENMRNLLGVMTNQSTEINILTNEYNKLGKKFGYNSDKALEVLKKIQDLRAEYQKTGQDIQDLADKMKDAQIDTINDVNDKLKDALKQRYQDEKDAAEKQVKLATDTQTKLLQAKIDGISDQESSLDSQYSDEDDADKEAELRRQLNMHWGAEKKKELQDELDDLIKTRERRHQKEELDQQKQSLQDQIDAIKEQQDQTLSTLDDFYDQKLSDANLEAESEKTLMNSSQQDLVALLHSYGEDYKLAGQDLGTRLVEGFKAPLSILQGMFDNLSKSLSMVQNVGVIPNSASLADVQTYLNQGGTSSSGTQTVNLNATQPTTIITNTYLDSKQVAKTITPYVSKIQGKNLVLNKRGI